MFNLEAGESSIAYGTIATVLKDGQVRATRVFLGERQTERAQEWETSFSQFETGITLSTASVTVEGPR